MILHPLASANVTCAQSGDDAALFEALMFGDPVDVKYPPVYIFPVLDLCVVVPTCSVIVAVTRLDISSLLARLRSGNTSVLKGAALVMLERLAAPRVFWYLFLCKSNRRLDWKVSSCSAHAWS